MSGKLDQSLDQILSDRKSTGPRRGRGRRAVNASRVTKAAPAGGIQKASKAKTTIAKPATNGAATTSETKIIVSNLPSDVSEAQIKEYFGQSVAPVKRAMLTYGPNGVSRGIATIIFGKPGSAQEAVKKLNGMLVDKRPMKIEVVMDAANATQRPNKTLSDRMTQPKSAAPKPAADIKAAKGTGSGTRGRPRRGRVGRPKPKTANELDAEMADYFDTTAANGSAAGNAPATNGATAAPAGDDMGMDEIS